jgi:hypothetical protein
MHQEFIAKASAEQSLSKITVPKNAGRASRAELCPAKDTDEYVGLPDLEDFCWSSVPSVWHIIGLCEK